MRNTAIQAFLTAHGWGAARRSKLTGDASQRRYERLSGTVNAILMDAGSAQADMIRSFTAMAAHLRNLGLSAPAILASAPEEGFVLLEDLGDNLFADLLIRDPKRAPQFYAAACDALITMQRAKPPNSLVSYDVSAMADAISPLFEWYGATQADGITQNLHDLLDRHLTGPQVLVHRDFHAENLIWLPNRDGPAQVGLLDFQDAVLGHPAYDLSSLLTDARRDVSQDLRQSTMTYYLDRSGRESAPFQTAVALCGIQRNLRIIGIFARLSRRDAKPRYADFIPRVWAYLQDDLRMPSLAGLRDRIDTALPAPSPHVLAGLKAAYV